MVIVVENCCTITGKCLFHVFPLSNDYLWFDYQFYSAYVHISLLCMYVYIALNCQVYVQIV